MDKYDRLANQASQMAVRGFPLSANRSQGRLFKKVYCKLYTVAHIHVNLYICVGM